MAPTPLPKPIKGKADWREYGALELENGVTVLAIHDKESKMTAMSCCVNVGASADPRSLSGLAHFVEHMCFLGSSKYPGENEYKRYLAAHGGRSNASTSMHLTNYKFEVLAEHAEKAVDIFSNFFIDPLFTSSGTNREVQAVDSENSKNLVADGRRRLQILKDLVDPDHYYSKFSTGNSKTLDTSDDSKVEYMRSALLAFHAKHYRPENFTVVLAGPQPLETLQEWITARFSRIKEKPFPTENMSDVEKLIAEAAKDAPPYSFKEPTPEHNSPFGSIKDSMPLLLTTKPLRSMRKLVLMFPMKSDRKIPDQSPSNCLSHLLGHEGEGSIFATLQSQGMISSLSSGARTSGPDFKLFSIDIELTEKGEEHWEEVAGTVFAYCRMLNKELDRESKNDSNEMRRIWEEHSKLDKIFFDQTSPGGTYSYAPNLSQRVNAYGTEECLSAGSMLNEDASTFPLDAVNETAKFLTPDNCLVERCSANAWEEAEKNADSSSFGFERKTEPWYGVEYIVAPMAEGTAKSWNGEEDESNNGKNQIDNTGLRLPNANRYIPRSLDLCEEVPEEARVPRIEKPINPPDLLINNKSGRLYHRLDDRYALPKSSLTLLIRNAATVHKRGDGYKWEFDSSAGLKSTMLSVMFSQAMAQETYDAELAGLYWNLSLGPSGIKLHCYGFSDRVPDLTTTVLERFLDGKFLDDAFFVSTKDRLVRGLQTFFSSRRSDAISLYYRDALLAAKDGSVSESLELVEGVDMEALRAHHKSIVENKEVLLECLFTGNVSATSAKTLFNDVDAAISSATKSSPETRPSLSYVPATDLERRVLPQEDIELHFQSENPQEENGSVVFTYQSSVPSYRGEGLSHDLSLKTTSAVRLLCHMLREPLFDELRTKQQLGYIVSSYYERGFSARQPDDEVLDPSMVPVDFITISVLSRKLPPTDVATRIDEFLEQFRSSLHEMPESEIRDHADALSKKLLKPIQKLLTESNDHFGKIHRFSPECISAMDEEKSEPLPWKTDEDLAECIQSLSRAELVDTWDQIIGPANRARIVSCVYGNTFPLANNSNGSGLMSSIGLGSRSARITNDFSKLVDYRQRMGVYNNRATTAGKRSFSSMLSTRNIFGSTSSKFSPVFGLGVIGAAGVVGWTFLRNQRTPSSK